MVVADCKEDIISAMRRALDQFENHPIPELRKITEVRDDFCGINATFYVADSVTEHILPMGWNKEYKEIEVLSKRGKDSLLRKQ